MPRDERTQTVAEVLGWTFTQDLPPNEQMANNALSVAIAFFPFIRRAQQAGGLKERGVVHVFDAQ